MFPGIPFPDVPLIAAFSIVLGRMAGLFSAIPLFGGKGVPIRIKVATIFTMSLLFFPVVRNSIPPLPKDLVSVSLLVGKEVLVGLSLGLLAELIMSAVEFSGQIIGTQMSFTMVSLFDPNMGGQESILVVFQKLLATLLFMVLNIHHSFIRAIVESYAVVPAGAWHVSDGLLRFMVAIVGGIFVLALKLAAPVMVALLAATVAIGILARVFPQINVFMVSMPLNIGLGLLILAASLPFFIHIASAAFGGLEQQITTLFRLLGQ